MKAALFFVLGLLVVIAVPLAVAAAKQLHQRKQKQERIMNELHRQERMVGSPYFRSKI